MARINHSLRHRATRIVYLGRFDSRRVSPGRWAFPSAEGQQSRYRNWDSDEPPGWKQSLFKLVEGGATALGSILVLGLAGYSYHVYYKSLVLQKMENAFAPGYSSLELVALSRQVKSLRDVGNLDDNEGGHDWIPMEEQTTVDGILDGTVRGHYYLITGEKGTGKTSMLLKAMRRVDGDGIAMLEAHSDPEIFRIRLGKALDYEFHEDYVGSLFSFRGPRDTTPLLDIERAFTKMEKIALSRRERCGKPLVLIINGVHLLRDDEDGRDLLELVQQRAELWAASNLVTVVLVSDDYWITERLMWQATRMRILPIHDIPKASAISALKSFRVNTYHEDTPSEILSQVFDKIGGRLTFLVRVARSPDMIEACKAICEREKRWLLSQSWLLGDTMDDDAEDQQEFCSSIWLLAKALIEKENSNQLSESHGLARIPLHEAREIMTRADFIEKLDHLNIFTIDSNCMVQADSVAMQQAFRDIYNSEGFEEHLRATLDRLDDLESLRRTREILQKESKPQMKSL